MQKDNQASITHRKLAEALAAIHSTVLELISSGAPLSDVLHVLSRIIEEQSPGLLCSILLLDPNGKTLRHGAAPSLPDSYKQAIDGMAIGPCAGSCGTAAYRGEPVVVSDIASDPLWSDYRNLALTHGLRACWSTPIVSTDGKVLGTFAMYYREARSPSLRDLQVIERATHLAAIAIERNRAKETLRQAENRYRSIVENAVEGFFQTTPEGGYLSVNPALARMYGYDSPEQLMASVSDIGHQVYIDPGRRAVFKRLMEEQGVARDFEYQVYRKDGRTIWLSENARAVRDASGAVLYYEGTVEDITERKRAEVKLRERTAYLHALIENSPLAIVAHDPQGRVEMCNPAFERLFQYRQSEIVGAALDELIATAELRAEANELTHGVVAGGTVHASARRRRKDETLVDVEIHGVPLTVDGKVRGGYGLYQDVTKRKRAEDALRESEERYRMLFDDNPQPMWVFDLETLKFLAVNDAAIQHYGYSRDEFLAMTIQEIRPPEDRAAFLERLSEQDPAVQVAGIWPHRKKDGTIIEVEIATHELRFGPRHARLVLVNDVTERRQLEHQLRQAQKMEAVGRLSGGIAHDFNNLLGVIIGYSEILEERLGQSDSLRKNAEEIKKAGQRAASLTRQLLAFSRQQVLEPKVLDLNAVVADTQKMLRRLIGEDIELTTVLDPALGRVKADQGQIEQVIMNLAVNARDAMPQGGKLTIETANAELDENYARQHLPTVPGRYVMLVVTDTGIGMDAETQAHIFEPFFTTKELGKGTGLGLATVYGVVKQSGGYIWVYSEPGQGTTFKIYLPRVEQTVQAFQSGAGPSKSLQHASETVLLVEDEELLRTLTRSSLIQNGYTVLEASSGTQAIEIAQRHQGPIHLLLTDVVMPGMSGRVLAENLTPSHPQMRVLYMSGYTDYAIASRGVLESGVSLLQKPFTREALTQKVREVLEEAAEGNKTGSTVGSMHRGE